MLSEDSITSILVAVSLVGLNNMCQSVVLVNYYGPAHLWSYATPAHTQSFSIDYIQLHAEVCLMKPLLHKQGQFLLAI